jgi:hypothetical protein
MDSRKQADGIQNGSVGLRWKFGEHITLLSHKLSTADEKFQRCTVNPQSE